LKDISLGGFGSLMLVGVANYEKGTTFQTGYSTEGVAVSLTDPLRVGGAWGVGGGIVYKLSLSNNSYVQLYALFGRGATNFSTATDLGTATGFETSFLALHPGTPAGTTVGTGNVINRQRMFRAGAMFIWNPVPVFSMALWGFWNLQDQGFFSTGTDGDGEFKKVSGNRNLVETGIRPVPARMVLVRAEIWVCSPSPRRSNRRAVTTLVPSCACLPLTQFGAIR